MRVAIGGLEILRGYASTDITPVDYGIRTFRELLVQPWREPTYDDGLPVGADRGTGALFAAIALPGVVFLVVRFAKRQTGALERLLLLCTAIGFLLWATALMRVPRFGLPVAAVFCALAAPMASVLVTKQRRMVLGLYFLGCSLSGLFCLAERVQRAVLRIRLGDFSRSTYYGYPEIVDRLPHGSRIADRTAGRNLAFVLAGGNLTNYVVPAGDNPENANYVVKDGAIDSEDEALLASGAKLIYDGMPPNLYPKTARRWRIYWIDRSSTVSR